jgi:CheY-like chemotaxis protein
MSFSVLLVEPHTDSREMYTEYFHFHGLTVRIADDPAGALASAHDIDAIVTASRLPSQRDALAMVRQLRATADTSDIPIVMLSATATTEEVSGAAEAGCDLLLPLPCTPSDLLWTIQRAVARRRFKTPRMIRFTRCTPRAARFAV